MAAAAIGMFFAADAGKRLLIVVIGGILSGFVLTELKYLAARQLRAMGLENVTLHLLLELLTPFLIYIVAEQAGVSGVFAVVTSGVMHSFFKRRLTAHSVSLRAASDSVWSMLYFALDGLVFLISIRHAAAVVACLYEKKRRRLS